MKHQNIRREISRLLQQRSHRRQYRITPSILIQTRVEWLSWLTKKYPRQMKKCKEAPVSFRDWCKMTYGHSH